MSIDLKEMALCEWVRTFPHAEHVQSFQDLTNGLVFGGILSEVSPQQFGQHHGSVDCDAVTNSPILAAKHIKTMIGLLLGYFKSDFNKSVNIDDINSTLIARNKDPNEIFKVLQLVVGAVVMCERKDEFIGKIFTLPRSAQRVLKGIVEAFMHSLEEYSPSSIPPRAQPDELSKTLGVVKHLRGEREKLAKEINDLKMRNLELHTQVEDLNNELKNVPSVSKYRTPTLVKERADEGGGDSSISSGIPVNKNQCKAETEELTRMLDEKNIENNILREELQQAVEAKETAQKEAAQRQLIIADMEEEVEEARGQAIKLAKAESTLLKYQQRLDEFAALKREHNGLKERLELYGALEQQLEDARATSEAAAKQVIESQKYNKTLQNEKSEFASLLVDKEEKLDEALKRIEILENLVAAAKASEMGRGEEVVRREGREVKIDNVLDVKIEDPHAIESRVQTDSATLEILRQKLVEAEAELEISREAASRARDEKERLEAFSRESMQAFKSKFTSTLKSLTEEKDMLEGALERLADRAEFDRETFRREERLLLSAVHGLGVDIMTMNIKKLVARDPTPMITGADNIRFTTESPSRSVLAETQSRQMLALDSLIE